jgi:hypothetical protein
MPLMKKVVGAQSGSISAWWMAIGAAANTPIGLPSSS